MDESEKVDFQIDVSATDATEEDVDRMTRQLLHELKKLDVDSVELTKGGPAPRGSKGDLVTLGSIMISSLPTVLPVVAALSNLGPLGERGAL